MSGRRPASRIAARLLAAGRARGTCVAARAADAPAARAGCDWRRAGELFACTLNARRRDDDGDDDNDDDRSDATTGDVDAGDEDDEYSSSAARLLRLLLMLDVWSVASVRAASAIVRRWRALGCACVRDSEPDLASPALRWLLNSDATDVVASRACVCCRRTAIGRQSRLTDALWWCSPSTADASGAAATTTTTAATTTTTTTRAAAPIDWRLVRARALTRHCATALRDAVVGATRDPSMSCVGGVRRLVAVAMRAPRLLAACAEAIRAPLFVVVRYANGSATRRCCFRLCLVDRRACSTRWHLPLSVHEAVVRDALVGDASVGDRRRRWRRRAVDVFSVAGAAVHDDRRPTLVGDERRVRTERLG